MRAARVQPLAGLREKRLEGRRPAARTRYALGTTVTIISSKMRAFPAWSQAIIVNGSGQAQCNVAIVGNRDFHATRQRQRPHCRSRACRKPPKRLRGRLVAKHSILYGFLCSDFIEGRNLIFSCRQPSKDSLRVRARPVAAAFAD
jgi:hypothetical protein